MIHVNFFEVFDRKGNCQHVASLVLGNVLYFLEGGKAREEVLIFDGQEEAHFLIDNG